MKALGQLVQMPLTQLCPATHTWLQAPQWTTLVARSTHAPPHWLSPAEQAEAHEPAWQIVPAGQTTPHAPQFAGSLWVLTHDALQATSPPTH